MPCDFKDSILAHCFSWEIQDSVYHLFPDPGSHPCKPLWPHFVCWLLQVRAGVIGILTGWSWLMSINCLDDKCLSFWNLFGFSIPSQCKPRPLDPFWQIQQPDLMNFFSVLIKILQRKCQVDRYIDLMMTDSCVNTYIHICMHTHIHTYSL